MMKGMFNYNHLFSHLSNCCTLCYYVGCWANLLLVLGVPVVIITVLKWLMPNHHWVCSICHECISCDSWGG